MTARKRRLRSQRGMVLFASLLILSVLMAAGVGALISTQTDFKTTANLKSGTQAFFVAEAGIAWAKEEIRRSAANPPNLPGGTQNFSAGDFSVSFVSYSQASPVTTKVVVRSTGAVGGAAQTIQAAVVKSYDLSDGAIGLRGAAIRVSFGGDGSFVVDGRDYDPATGSLIDGGKARAAISVSEDAVKAQVEEELDRFRQNDLTGKEATVADVARSDALPLQAVARLADDLCGAANAQINAIPADGTMTLEGQTWGTRSAPELRCIAGLPDPGDAVNFQGNVSGAGILVVKDAEAVVNGSFRWEGLILVSGNRVGFRIEGGDSKEIYGSLIIAETNPDSVEAAANLSLQGAVKTLYSGEALNRAAALIPSSVLESLYGSLPATIVQDYWRVVTP